MLSASGELKPKSGGSSVDGNSPHRSIYVKKRRNSPDPILAAFDAPAGFASASETRYDHLDPGSALTQQPMAPCQSPSHGEEILDTRNP